jgi:quinol monooxygenase YgiN
MWVTALAGSMAGEVIEVAPQSRSTWPQRFSRTVEGVPPMLTKALLVRLEALPGKETELATFLTEARSIVMEEPGTVAWFAIQFGPSTFGVYDVFPDDEARDAHLAGGVGQALGPNTGVLFSEPQIEKVDILADKVPG